MAELIYSAIASLDGYIEDATGAFDWSAPDEEMMGFLNELEAPIGTYLYGRRMYETMLFWETAELDPQGAPLETGWALMWRAADKVVYSRTLPEVSSARTRLEREFDVEAVAAMKRDLDRDITVGGPALASAAFAAGLVDRCQLFLTPISVGSGKAALPRDLRVDLELIEQRRFANGAVYLDYRVR